MVFGWGRKKAPPPEIEVVRIRLEEAPRIAGDVLEKRSEGIVTEAANTLHRTNELMRELMRIREDLERDDLDLEAVDKRLQPLAVRGKKMLVDALRKNAFEMEPIGAPEDMARVSGELEHRLKRLGNILGKQTRVIHTFAETYAQRLVQILEEVESNRKSLMDLSGRHLADEGVANAVTGGVANVGAMKTSAIENIQRCEGAKDEVEDLDIRAARMESDIRAFQESEEYTSLLAMRHRLDAYEEEKSRLAAEISTRFTSISRPLGRYERVSADKDQTALLYRVRKSAYDVMNPDDAEGVVSLLEGVRRAVASGAISVKDTDKALEAIARTSDAISVYTERVGKMESTLSRTRDMIRDAEPVRLHKMEKDLESMREAKEIATQKATETMAAATAAVASIPDEISQVQRALLRLTGTRYDITYEVPG